MKVMGVPHRVVLNEWLLHDLSGGNGIAGQRRGFLVLETLIRADFQLCLLATSPWVQKAYSLMSDHRPPVRQLSKSLWLGILYDSRKSLWIDSSHITADARASAEIASPADRYLVETLVSVGARELVSTDEPLIATYSGHPRVQVVHRDLFFPPERIDGGGMDEYARLTR